MKHLLRKSMTLCLMASFLLSLLGPTTTQAAVDVAFNYPLGTAEQQWDGLRPIIRTIEGANRGQTFRAAIYALDSDPLADAMIDAHRRGVNIQVLLNDHITTSTFTRLKNYLNQNTTDESFARQCKGSCRRAGADGVMHMKMYLLTGNGEQVAYISSANLTRNAMGNQWNDTLKLYNEGPVHTELNRVFDEMRDNSYGTERTLAIRSTYVDAKYRASTYPKPATTANDAIIWALNRVKCTGVTGTAGSGGRTVIRINNYAWWGNRGLAIATKVKNLHNAGCRVSIILGPDSGYSVRQQLQPILRQSSSKIHDDVKDAEAYSHHKYMAISGNFNGDTDARVVYTGSQNWSDSTQYRDDNVFMIKSTEIYDAYDAHHKFMLSNYGK